MSALIVDRIRDFIAGLNLESKVLSLSNDGVNTTLIVENVFHIRATPFPYQRTVKIDGTDQTILAVDYNTNSVTISGIVASASTYKVDNPFYFHGTLISTANEIRLLSDDQKVPMIYLNEIIGETRLKRPSSLASIAQIRLAFADVYSNDWTRAEHYDLLIRPLCNLSDFVFSKLDTNSCLRFESDVRQRTVPKWGEIKRKGVEKKSFNEYLDAIEWTFDLGICNC